MRGPASHHPSTFPPAILSNALGGPASLVTLHYNKVKTFERNKKEIIERAKKRPKEEARVARTRCCQKIIIIKIHLQSCSEEHTISLFIWGQQDYGHALSHHQHHIVMNSSTSLLSSHPATISSTAALSTPHDAISTSSSTLVNPDLTENTIRRRRQQQQQQQLPITTTSLRRQFNEKMRRKNPNLNGWLKSEEAHQSPPLTDRKEYPDDHRCSDQETASGLCGCNLNASPDSDSGNSSSPATVSEKNDRETRESTYHYDQQLLAARKRKLIMERTRSKTLEDMTVMETSLSAGQRNITAKRYNGAEHLTRNPSRNLSSDPVLIPRPDYVGTSRSAFDQDMGGNASSSEDERWRFKGPILDRRWNSSPVRPTSQSQSRPLPTSQSSTDKYPNSFEIPTKTIRNQEAAISAHPSAARKSINSVFEKLLKEEEQRREDERAKKEAARERRKELKKRKDAEWPSSKEENPEIAPNFVGSYEPATEVGSIVRAAESGTKGQGKLSSSFSDAKDLHSSSSERQARSDSNRLDRLSRSSSKNETVQRLAPRPSPEKPSAQSYKAKLAALRSASLSLESKREEDNSTLSQTRNLLSYQALTPDSSMLDVNGSIISDSLEGKISTNQQYQNQNSANMEEMISEEDQVTIGSDFHGQAPLQSTPPRIGSSTRSRSISTSPLQMRKPKETLPTQDPLRDTLRDLTTVLKEFRDSKTGAAWEEIEGSVRDLKEASEVEQSEKAIHRASFVDVEERRKQTNEIDEAYAEKLGMIRTRLRKIKTKTPTIVKSNGNTIRSSSKRNLIITFLIQLLFAYLMMTAAELRARQLFMTTYYDPFLPHDAIDLSQTSVGNLFASLIYRGKGFLTGGYTTEDKLILTGPSWSGHLGWIVNQVLLSNDRGKAIKLLFLNILGLGDGDVFQLANFAPT